MGQRELSAAFELLKQERDTVENLQKALHTRDMIGQAKGILMARHNITADAAFAILQDESSRNQRKLIDIAEQLTYTG